MLSWFKETIPPSPLSLELEIDHKTTFTTLERITGRLTIKPLINTEFDSLNIKLLGASRTYGRRVVPQAPDARTVTTYHRFLELTQPDLHLRLPGDRIFKAGYDYVFPFEFAVPERMLPTTCRHEVSSPGVHRLHTLMPPSLGDPKSNGMTDYSPQDVSIKYRIVANVQRKEEASDPSKTAQLAGCAIPIRFRPVYAADTFPVEPWTQNTSDEKDLLLRQLWARPAGKLVVASAHVTPFRIRQLHSDLWQSNLSGQVTIDLLFHPANDAAKPPGQVSLSGLLRTKTSSAVEPLPQLPFDSQWSGPELDVHTSPSVILSSYTNRTTIWSRRSPGTSQPGESCPSYESATEGASAPSASSPPPYSHTNKPYYMAQIVVPLTAAIGFTLVPSFHSCLVSRTYSLDLKLSVQDTGIGSVSTTRLKLPVQTVLERAALRRDSSVAWSDMGDEDSAPGQGRMSPRGMDNDNDLPPDYEHSSV